MTQFVPYLTLTAPNRSIIGQCVAPHLLTGDLYLTQSINEGEDGIDDLIITRFVGGVPVASQLCVNGGHGDELYVGGTADKPVVSFRYGGESGSHASSGTWVRIPFDGKTWTLSKALKYDVTGPAVASPARRGWWQGEATHLDTVYRLYGTPYGLNGPTGGAPAMPAFIEVVRGGQIRSTIDCSDLGRENGKPIGGRLEPEGMALTWIDGNPHLLVGIAIGRKGAYRHQLYTYALAKVTEAPPETVDLPVVSAPKQPFRSRRLHWHVADSLTGNILGQLNPSSWSIDEPAEGSSTGTITVAIPTRSADRARLRTLLRPRRCWVAIEDDTGDFLDFAGPVIAPPTVAGGNLIIRVVDWRSWFYIAFIRPNANVPVRRYVRRKNKVEQTTIMTTLARLGLDTTGAPKIVIDDARSSGIPRSIVAEMLDQSIGESLDSVMGRHRGCEWWTYPTYASDDTKLLAHFAVAWPERRTTSKRWLLDADINGGTVISWEPLDPDEGFTRTWAIGQADGKSKPPWGKSETTALRRGQDVAWEQVVQADSADTRKEAYAYAAKQTKGAAVKGLADFTVAAERIPLTSIGLGDRVRVKVNNGWDYHNLDGPRIVRRTMTGGNGMATTQTLTVDLDDLR